MSVCQSFGRSTTAIPYNKYDLSICNHIQLLKHSKLRILTQFLCDVQFFRVKTYQLLQPKLVLKHQRLSLSTSSPS